jgi:glycosyltransferase involved in cell wall biosynthesis
MNKVSVIVPVYNSETFLLKCIDSILEQTHHNIELILVNDGSTDNSGEICNNYAEKDARVRVIHQENMGVSAARNTGICHATGDYLQFVDSDDFIDKNMTEILVNAIEKNSAAVAICGYKRIDSSTGVCIQNCYSSKTGFYSFKELLNIFDYLYLKWLINSPCNKIYRTQIIRDNYIFYRKGIELGEDLLFNLDVIQKSTSFEIIPECPYNYVKNNNGTLTSKGRKNLYEIQKMLFENIISLYEDRESYKYQINNLEKFYSKRILDIVLHVANSYSIKEVKSYLKTARNIREDAVFNKTMNSVEVITPQEKLMKFLMENKLFCSIFIYAKTKRSLREKIPSLFRVLKSWNVDFITFF